MRWFQRSSDATTDVAGSTSAYAVLLDEARRSETTQRELHSAVDQRAGVLIGFAGVLVTLLLSGDARGFMPVWAWVTSTAMAGVAALAAAYPMTMKLPATLSAAGLLQKYGDASTEEVIRTVAGSAAFLAAKAQDSLSVKAGWVRAAAIVLAASVAVSVIGTIVDAATPDAAGVTEHGTPRPSEAGED